MARPIRPVLGLLAAMVLAPAPAAGEEGASATTGQFLVAAESMPDPRFQGTVIYMVQHDSAGAFGIVINRAIAEVSGGELASELDLELDGPAVESQFALRWGGPVDPTLLFVLHSDDYGGQDSLAVTKGVVLSAGRKVVGDLLVGRGPARSLVALGYSGWAPGQLESELRRDDWVVVPGDPELVFSDDLAGLWRQAMDRLGIDL